VWFIVAISGGLRRENAGPQRLFDDSEKDRKDQ
jgi:hypothetical protein